VLASARDDHWEVVAGGCLLGAELQPLAFRFAFGTLDPDTAQPDAVRKRFVVEHSPVWAFTFARKCP
jgi:hypothetical protein